AVVGEAGARAGPVGGGHRDDGAAVAGVVAADIGVRVAGRHHHRGATTDGAVDRALVARRAAARAAQAHVDHLGRLRVAGHAADAATGGPHDAIGDVGQVTAASAKHAYRYDLGAEGDTGHAGVVV